MSRAAVRQNCRLQSQCFHRFSRNVKANSREQAKKRKHRPLGGALSSGCTAVS